MININNTQKEHIILYLYHQLLQLNHSYAARCDVIKDKNNRDFVRLFNARHKITNSDKIPDFWVNQAKKDVKEINLKIRKEVLNMSNDKLILLLNDNTECNNFLNQLIGKDDEHDCFLRCN